MSSRYLLGLVGHPVSRSLSPPMHKAALHFCHLEGDYELFDIAAESLPGEIVRLKERGLTGFNITIPHKTAILKYCHSSSPAVQKVGAANTVMFQTDGTLAADNTDIAGFSSALLAAFGQTIKWQPKKTGAACLLGAGGAAKAALAVLFDHGFDPVFVLARDLTKAQILCQDWSDRIKDTAQPRAVGFSDYATICDADLFVSTIPYGQTVEIDREFLSTLFQKSGKKDCSVFDMVYSRDGAETALIKLARELELPACDGTPMLVGQAQAAFKIWTGRDVPFEIMNNALVEARTASLNQFL